MIVSVRARQYDHHGFLKKLWRSSAWSFKLRDGRQTHLPHQPPRRSSAFICRLQEFGAMVTNICNYLTPIKDRQRRHQYQIAASSALN